MATKKKELTIGIILMGSFIGVLILMLLPIYGKGMDFLFYADDVFNKLAKGSADFIPKLKKDVEKFRGKELNITIDLKRPGDDPKRLAERVELCTKLYKTNGFDVEAQDSKFTIKGDLAKILLAALEDAELLYHNKGDVFQQKYGVADFKRMFRQWHNSLSPVQKRLTLDKKVDEAKIVGEVIRKAIETAYNFYGVEAMKVKEKAGLMSAMLAWYIIYTVWYGFAMLYLFEGLGLSTKKAKVKKEV